MASMWLIAPLAALSTFVFNFAWFGPLKMWTHWTNALGLTEEDLHGKDHTAPILFGSVLAALLVETLVVLWLLSTAYAAPTAMDGAVLGLALGGGVAATTSLGHRMFAAQGFKVWLIEVTPDVVGLVMIGAVLGAFL
jgi:hypothetical protein